MTISVIKCASPSIFVQAGPVMAVMAVMAAMAAMNQRCVVAAWCVVVESELAAPATTATAAPIAIMVLTLRPATVVAPAAAGAAAAADAGAVWAIACAEAKHRIADAIKIFFMNYPLDVSRERANDTQL